MQPALEAARARADTAELVSPTSEMISAADRLSIDRAALDQVGMTAQLPAPPGRVHLLAPSDVQGRLDPESLRDVMSSNLAELERCYTDVLRGDRHAVGRVVAQWTITRGRVTEVEIAAGALASEGVNTCLAEWLRALRVRAGGTVVLTQPFLFHQG